MLRQFYKLLAVLSILSLLACENTFNAPLKVAVILDVERTWDLTALEWAKDNVNDAGGVLAVRPIELVYFEAQSDSQLNSRLREITEDPDIVAVIGPSTAEQTITATRRLASSKLVMVTPTVTASEIYRKFGDDDYVWRTVESDIAQTETMILAAWATGAEKVALLTTFSLYGSTFFDWFGFFAAEVGYPSGTVHVDRYGQEGSNMTTDCILPVNTLLDNRPDVLFAVPESDEQVICIVQAVANYNAANETNIRLNFSSEGYRSDVLFSLGTLAEGVEGIAPIPAPENGFELEYKYMYPDKDLPPYAANMYDALLLIAYGLEQSGGRGGEPLADSLKEVVSYRGEPVGWDKDGVKDALLAIRENRRPNLTGATGTLTYQDDVFTDLKESSYGHWRFEGGRMVFSAYYATGENSVRTRSSDAIFEARASTGAQQNIAFGQESHPVGPQEDLWVFIISVSKDFANYRHESDALRQYRIFKDRGITDDRIILAVADDIADNPLNPEPGTIRNQVGGVNLYPGIEIDYRLDMISIELILAVLSGDTQDGKYEHVIESTNTSNVYIYMVGHGGPKGVAVGAGRPEDAFLPAELSGIEYLDPEVFLESLCGMQARQGYRRGLVVIEACFSGVMGEALSLGCGEAQQVPDIINVGEEPAGENCENGGERLDIGPDADGDSVPDSINSSHYSCDDDTGDGMMYVSSEVTSEEECVSCPIGGLRYGQGHDLDASGWLSAEEITYIGCVCEKDSTTKLNNLLMLTAANSSENSLSYEYDPLTDVWLADQFSAKFFEVLSSEEVYNLYEVYNQVYLNVSGSHVSMYNSYYFGDVREIMIEEFLRKED